MLKYEYKNATVYITKPTEKHIENIKKATEVFMQRIIKEELQNGIRESDRGASRNNPHARKRNKQA